jgi:pSer/pThr/pTyr-binding forkhead associated (FHA) protein
MDVKLIVQGGQTRNRVLVVRDPESIVGRAQGSAVRIPSAEVSRQHCLFRLEHGYLTVEDLGSLNGTFLNGTPVVGRQAVLPGDRVEVGPIAFLVQYELTPEAVEHLRGTGEDEFEIVDEVLEVQEEELPRLPVVEEEENVPVLPILEGPGDPEDEVIVELENADDPLDVRTRPKPPKDNGGPR